MKNAFQFKNILVVRTFCHSRYLNTLNKILRLALISYSKESYLYTRYYLSISTFQFVSYSTCSIDDGNTQLE